MEMSLREIARIHESVRNDPELTVHCAGTAALLAAPTGMKRLKGKRREKNQRGLILGLTIRKSANAYTAPRFDLDVKGKKVGTKAEWTATVRKTEAKDIALDCFYCGAGVHELDGKSYWIPSAIAQKVKLGEEEHLADTKLAFDLTYGLIAKSVNSLVGKSFGPAEKRDVVEKQAKDALAALLPPVLGTFEGDWFKVLEKMLAMTDKRDTQLWHAFEEKKVEKRNGKYVTRIGPGTFAQVGQTSSAQLVTYPKQP